MVAQKIGIILEVGPNSNLVVERFTVVVPVEENTQKKPSSGRLMSIDIFRGLAVAGMILVDNPGSDDKAYAPIQHSQWNGWTAADLIFPSFLFLVGVSLVFSFSRVFAEASHGRKS